MIVVDGFSTLTDFYQAKDGRRNFNKEMIDKICDFRMVKNFVLCTVSMALSIAAIVTGDSKLQVRMGSSSGVIPIGLAVFPTFRMKGD